MKPLFPVEETRPLFARRSSFGTCVPLVAANPYALLAICGQFVIEASGMATQLQQAYDVIQKKLQPVTDQMYDKDKNKTVEKILAAAEEKTNIKREKLVYGALAGLLIYFIIGALAQILSNIVGFAYPAYRSIKAVRSPIKEDDTQWLIYWIVFASFSIIDFSIFSTVPFYWLFKRFYNFMRLGTGSDVEKMT
ncbi:TB2/DP1, HVA22 family [Ancylostoma ceylanicum]|uniref:Receptor expression-enhancing protein n=1 Tax=Ancylostoma ceylanicum TaxID=53326 RepID=A0A0D6L8T6_9BILA|nr:TB2/DP1, HVA22 family [Ancylostoma ceylanicum]